MEPTTGCGPHGPCQARGQTGMGPSGIQARQAQRCLCHACHHTCSARPGTVCHSLTIDIPRPRALKTKREPKFLEYADEIWTVIEREGQRQGLIAPDAATANSEVARAEV